MSFYQRILLICAVFSIGFLSAGVFNALTLNQVKVNGPVYSEIVQQKDLLADILPPPAYLIESYLVSLQLAAGAETEMPALLDKTRSLAKDFEERELFWEKSLPEGPARSIFLGKVYPAGKRFIELQQNRFIPALKQGDAKLVELAKQQLTLAYLEHRSAVDELVAVATENAKQQETAASELVFSKTLQVVAVTAIFLVLGLVVAWTSLQRIMRQLGGDPAYVAEIAQGMAQGRLLDFEVRTGDQESLLAAMQRMVATFRRFAEAQEENTREHANGMVGHRIEAEQFPGIYGEMANSINRLAQTHIAVSAQIVAVVQEYAQGDLSRDMPPLPGENARISQAIAGVKTSLQGINQEIRSLVEAALAGNFKARGQAESFQHEFRAMVDGLNRLMAITERGLDDLSAVLAALARGDLTQQMTGDYQGTFARLRDDANQSVQQLEQAVMTIQMAADAIDTAAKEIAAGNHDLSDRTERQAASLEETASSMDEFTGTVKQNAENARQASEMAAQAEKVAIRGGEVVSKVVNTMNDIHASSNRIADITSVIDGIAFQTNILALNAAVEAARAGEQGRGFAVVASEVRNLAQRSAQAAKEIKQLIDESADKVGNGGRLVEDAGKTMTEVVRRVQEVTRIIADISTASREQSVGIEQVSLAVSQMDETTQQNAALVEQAAGAAGSLETQARALVEAVSIFKLSTSAHSGGARASGEVPLLKQAPRMDDAWHEF